MFSINNEPILSFNTFLLFNNTVYLDKLITWNLLIYITTNK